MTRKQGIRTVLFFICTVLVFLLLENIVGVDKTITNGSRQKGYYMQPKDSLDAVFLGRSMVDTDWAAPLAWEQEGITVYPLASNDQLFCITSYLIKEAQKGQNPKLYIVDVHGIREEAMGSIAHRLRLVTDNMPLSINKINLVQTVSDWEELYRKTHDETEKIIQSDTIAEDLSYYCGFVNNHARWEKLLKESKQEKKLTLPSSLLAFSNLKRQKEKVTKPDPPSDSYWSPYAAAVFTEFLDFCEETNTPVLFVSLPSIEDDADYKQMNAALEMAEARNFPTLNLNTSQIYKEMNLNFDTDFIDNDHLNNKGAIKATTYITSYLIKNYDFPDKRGDTKYKHWDEAVKLFNFQK